MSDGRDDKDRSKTRVMYPVEDASIPRTPSLEDMLAQARKFRIEQTARSIFERSVTSVLLSTSPSILQKDYPIYFKRLSEKALEAAETFEDAVDSREK